MRTPPLLKGTIMATLALIVAAPFVTLIMVTILADIFGKKSRWSTK